MDAELTSEERMEELEARVRAGRRYTRFLTVATVIAFYIWRPVPPPKQTYLSLGPPMSMTDRELSYTDTRLSANGLVIHPGLDKSASLTSEYLALYDNHSSADGPDPSAVGLEVEVRRVTASGSIKVAGNVTSEITIDTKTGAWTLVRYRAGDKDHAVTTQLVAPLP